jgi:hypothetical protein
MNNSHAWFYKIFSSGPAIWIYGLLCSVLGICMLMYVPRRYNDNSLYRREYLMNSKTYKVETVTGKQLNTEEPGNAMGIRVGGGMFLVVGGFLIWTCVKEQKI